MVVEVVIIKCHFYDKCNAAYVWQRKVVKKAAKNASNR